MLMRARRAAAAGLLAATLAAGSAAPALADTLTDPPPEPGVPVNFGQCAAFEARDFPPGPEHGQDLSMARLFNPSGLDLQCPKTTP
jgi:hypothetical protein